jgi:hypothetical protein
VAFGIQRILFIIHAFFSVVETTVSATKSTSYQVEKILVGLDRNCIERRSLFSVAEETVGEAPNIECLL